MEHLFLREIISYLICKYIATVKSQFKTHIESIHGGVRYPCDQCQYKATTISTLKRHIESIHKGAAYLCDQCQYIATIMSSLNTY